MEATLRHLKAFGRPAGVDKENKIINGVVIAERGVFRSERGQFNEESLRLAAGLINATPNGVKSNFGHESLFTDSLGTYLGRMRDAYMDGPKKLRANLHLDETAFASPKGDMGTYVLNLATNDPEALGASLVLRAVDVPGPRGEPAIWRPTAIEAADVVSRGDATRSFLQANARDEDEVKPDTPRMDDLRIRLDEMELMTRKLGAKRG